MPLELGCRGDARIARSVGGVLDDDGGPSGRLACGDRKLDRALEKLVRQLQLEPVLGIDLVFGQTVRMIEIADDRRPAVPPSPLVASKKRVMANVEQGKAIIMASYEPAAALASSLE